MQSNQIDFATTLNLFVSIANLIAVIIIPILAVIVGQHLQNRSEKRKDKMNIFKTLISGRIFYGGWTSAECVNALNLIEIVFADNKEVCKQWRKYYQVVGIQGNKATKEQLDQITVEQNELLKRIGQALDYRDEATLQILQHPYMPVGMSTQMYQQQEYMNNQSFAMQQIAKMFQNPGNNVSNRVQVNNCSAKCKENDKNETVKPKSLQK